MSSGDYRRRIATFSDLLDDDNDNEEVPSPPPRVTRRRVVVVPSGVSSAAPRQQRRRTPSSPPRRRRRSPSPPQNNYFPTQTEDTTFSIVPPMQVEYNTRTSKCFDLIMLDEETAIDYLERDEEDNVIILNKPEGVAICFTRSGIRALIEDRSSHFVECLGPEVDEFTGDKGQRWIEPNPPLYVRVPVNPETGSNAFIPIENLREAISSSEERVYCLVPLALGDGSGVQASLSHTITEAARRGESSYISANHCQRGSNVLLYKFVRCRFLSKF